MLPLMMAGSSVLGSLGGGGSPLGGMGGGGGATGATDTQTVETTAEATAGGGSFTVGGGKLDNTLLILGGLVLVALLFTRGRR